MMTRLYTALWALLALIPAAAQTTLDAYIQRPEPEYRVELLERDRGIATDTYFLRLTSLRWRNESEVNKPLWRHQLTISVPNFSLCDDDVPQTAILVINGGDNPPNDEFDSEGSELFELITLGICAVVVDLGQIPNQPLIFADEVANTGAGREREEDELLAYGMNQYLETDDPEWIVQMAMTKAVVKAMDAVQTFLVDEIDHTIDDFVLLGGSKRGWTAWLTAAVDPRVKLLVPISADLLNLDEQFHHHFEVYGDFAPALAPYEAFDHPCRSQSGRGQTMLDIIDPYRYRQRFNTVPALLINSAGDQFFVSDSAQFYYHDLPGPQWLRYTVNSDHAQIDSEREAVDLFLGVRAWLERLNEGDQAPTISWRVEGDQLIVETSSEPRQVRLWQAVNPNGRDFRLERIGEAWEATTLDPVGERYQATLTPPPQGYRASLIEVTFAGSGPLGGDHVYTTEVYIRPDAKPYAGRACEPMEQLTGLWWNPTQSGQALQLIQQGETLLGAWYHYDDAGNGRWVNLFAQFEGDLASGELVGYGGSDIGEPWDEAAWQGSAVGSATLRRRSERSLELRYELDGRTGVFNFVPFEPLAEAAITGVWYDPAKVGQGLQLLLREGQLSGAWYHYDDGGEPRWLTFSGTLTDDVMSAELLRFSGPPLQPQWNEEAVQGKTVGTIRLERQGEQLQLNATLEGRQEEQRLTRLAP